MAARKKPSAQSADSFPPIWDRVYVFHGDQFLVDCAMAEALLDVTDKRRVDPEQGAVGLRVALSAFSFQDPTPAVVVCGPNADQCEALLATCDGSEEFTGSMLVVYGGSGKKLDGRTAFMRAANKAKRVWNFSPIEAGDAQTLRQHLLEWEKATGFALSADAKKYILSSVPTRQTRTEDGKTSDVVDLAMLECEMSKLLCVAQVEQSTPKSSIDANLVRAICQFSAGGIDVWRFANAVVAGRFREFLPSLRLMGLSKTDQSALWVLYSHLDLTAQVYFLASGGLQNSDKIAERLSTRVGGYHVQDGATPLPTVSSWRVKRILEDAAGKCRFAIAEAQLSAVASAIRDLRSGLAPSIVSTHLALALATVAKYQAPLLADPL